MAQANGMRVIRGLESAEFSGVVLTIGNFDGVHRGHQAILSAGRRRAEGAATQLVVMTFEPHPLAILTPEHVPPVLTPLNEKLRWIEWLGADVAVLVESRRDFLGLTAEAFISEVIVGRFAPAAMVEGASFGFGRHRQGDVETLRAAGKRHGFEVEVVEPIRVALGGHPDTVISSSLVRQLLASGTVDAAATCLGRPYALFGRVVRGAGRGQLLGFPTANVHVDGQLIPCEGVYAGRGAVGERTWAAAISVGRSPTFDQHELVVEAYLLDYAGTLYDQPIRIEFVEWLRDQRRFASVDELRRQIELDVARTREIHRVHADCSQP